MANRFVAKLFHALARIYTVLSALLQVVWQIKESMKVKRGRWENFTRGKGIEALDFYAAAFTAKTPLQESPQIQCGFTTTQLVSIVSPRHGASNLVAATDR